MQLARGPGTVNLDALNAQLRELTETITERSRH
jgi:hypothetical protein